MDRGLDEVVGAPSPADHPGPAGIVAFWRAAGRQRWFSHDQAFDQDIRRRFAAVQRLAARAELASWGRTAEGALARLLLLDQFPRNMFRGSAEAFATDPLALAAADTAVGRGLDRRVELELQPFFYLPFEHDETPASQTRGLELMEAFTSRGGEESYLRYARLHGDLIARFGRFPHRNAVLGRVSTPEEEAYLTAGGFKG